MTDSQSGHAPGPVPIFTQSPPRLGNQYGDDSFLRGFLQRKLPADVLKDVEPELDAMGELAGGDLYDMQLADRLNEPQLTQWDAWGNRIDRIDVSPLWQRAAEIAARCGLVSIPYERSHGRWSRLHQFALVYLFHPSSDVYTCPLAMSDGAARTLQVSGNTALIERVLPRLTSRDPASAWTSGQWMTEAAGGSDVGQSLTRAIQDADGTWRLYGKKWFTSAITSQMALTLARPEGNGAGGAGLAMFHVETHDARGRLNGLRVERLKDKLGTRKVPTAELLLDGTVAELVGEARNGTRNIEPMLVVTRTWNAVTSAAFMRRGVALAKSYASQRRAFGATLSDLPLHVDTLAGMEAETRAASLLAFELVELLGRAETGEIDAAQRAQLRMITPIAKLLTARQAVTVTSEAIEAFGGGGYVEDTGLPLLARDAQVLPIWEGTTNVLALDTLLRGDIGAGLAALADRFAGVRSQLDDTALVELAALADRSLDQVGAWLREHGDATQLQAGARRVVLTLGRAWELMLLVEHAHWCASHDDDGSALAAAQRFAANGINLLAEVSHQQSIALLR
jgi:alkylation response protein AidB-like acyl-CoA dehydrogenase